MYVLGIDGGGTKTKAVIADRFGNIYASETAGATNRNGAEAGSVERELSALFASLKKQDEQAFAGIQVVFAGMSGVDRPEAKAAMEKLLEAYMPATARIRADNDAINALYSGTLGVPGIVQIAGTGSITFGVNEKGERRRAGGWGYLIDDEGSGYDIGRAALHAVFKEYDGRGQKTLLTNMLLQHFGAEEPPELIPFIYEAGKARMAIAPLSRYVSKAADEQDEVANMILRDASFKLAGSIETLCRGLFKDFNGEIPVVLAGGVFERDDLLVPFIQQKVRELNVRVRLVKPELPPVAGAVIAGFAAVGETIEGSFLKNMKVETKIHY